MIKKFLFFVFIIIFPCLVFADENKNEMAKIIKINFDENDNLEIISDKKIDFTTYLLDAPQRLVIDVLSAEKIDENILKIKFPDFILNLRSSYNQQNLRLVFDLKQKIIIQSAKYQKLKNNDNGKIIVKILPEISYLIKNKDEKLLPKNIAANKKVKLGNSSPKQNIDEKKSQKKTPIIVIDAGHGGKDPGTIGEYARTKEKNITLSYAKELAKHLGNSKKYKVYLTRNSDIFIPLGQRVSKARKVDADLFISLHANSASDSNAKGLSIYTLSEKASDKQSELLAQKENRADIISGINFENASSDILKTLIDLSQRSSMNHSSRFANIAIKSVEKNGVVILHNTHRFAGFVVLTAPDMVSVLIELGYLSNSDEEEDLNSLSHKRKIIKGLVEAIDEYFEFH